jgi:hypothetical protein
MPSAVTLMPSERAISMTALTIVNVRASRMHSTVKLRSIFSRWIGRSRRCARLEKPTPKSSRASRTPALRMRTRFSRDTADVSSSPVSVTSTSISVGATS